VYEFIPNDVHEASCRTWNVTVARLPRYRSLFQELGATSREISDLTTHSMRMRDEACAYRTEGDTFYARGAQATNVLNTVLDRFAANNGVPRADADLFFAGRLRMITELLETSCGPQATQVAEANADYIMQGGSQPAAFGLGCPDLSRVGSPSIGGMANCLRTAIAEAAPCIDPVAGDNDETETEPEGETPAAPAAEEPPPPPPPPPPEPVPGDRNGDGRFDDADLPNGFSPSRELAYQRIERLNEKAENAAGWVGATGGVLGAAGIAFISPFAAALKLGAVINNAVWGRPSEGQYSEPTRLPPNWERNLECVGFPVGESVVGYVHPVRGDSMRLADIAFDCMCDETAGTAIHRASSTCGNSDTARRADCLRNPVGPDDNVRPECIDMLEEDHPALWTGGSPSNAICGVFHCDGSGMSQAFEDADGNTSCHCDTHDSSVVGGGLANNCEAVLCPSGSRAVPKADGSCGCNLSSGLPGVGSPTEPILPSFGGGSPLPPLPR
jgi:hypothetical protein